MTAGTTAGATVEPNEPWHNGWLRNHSVWWTWQAPKTGAVIVAITGAPFSERLTAIYEGGDLGSLAPVAGGSYGGWPYDTCVVSFEASANTKYAIAVDGWGDGGPVTLYIIQA